MKNDEALTVDEVAEILQVSRNTVYALKNRGELASFKVGRKLRFSYTDVQAYIAKSKTSREPDESTALPTRRDSSGQYQDMS